MNLVLCSFPFSGAFFVAWSRGSMGALVFLLRQLMFL
jgi:hypothetical protein